MMKFYRRYIQFNDLVIDGYDMLTDSDATNVSFDVSKHPYTFRNGDYAPLKSRTPRIESTTVGFTLLLSMKKISCDLREFYRRFVIEQISKAGKLWAVQNNELIWAYAIPQSYSEPTMGVRRGELEMDVELYLPQGVWHKADKQRTFIKENDTCEFLRCLDYKKLNPCCDCGWCDQPKMNCCCCDEMTEDDALCKNEDLLQEMYAECRGGYRIFYDCNAAERLFTNDINPFLGQRICRERGEEIIAGQVYVESDIPTTNYRIYLNGNGEDIVITINGNTNILKGKYTGPIYIDGSGNIYDKCGDLVEVENYIIPEGNYFGFIFYPGWNSVIIEPNECCSMQCVYIWIDNLTV